MFLYYKELEDSPDLNSSYIHGSGSYHFQNYLSPLTTQSSTSIPPIARDQDTPLNKPLLKNMCIQALGIIFFTLRKKNKEDDEELDRWPLRETPIPPKDMNSKSVVREEVLAMSPPRQVAVGGGGGLQGYGRERQVEAEGWPMKSRGT